MRKFALFATLLAVCGNAHAGVVFEVETKTREATQSLTMAVEGQNIKMDIPAAEQQSGKGKMIFRGDRGKMGEVIVVDDSSRSYHVMDDETMAALSGYVNDAMKQMEQMLEQLPPEQRAAIEKAQAQGLGMPGMPAGSETSKPELVDTGEKGTKNGYPCVKYEVRRDGRMLREIWITDWRNVEGGDEAGAAFRKLGAFFESMLESMPAIPGGGALADEMGFDVGFPVVSRSFDDAGNEEDMSTLKSATRQRLDPSEFEPPAGYKRMSMGPGGP